MTFVSIMQRSGRVFLLLFFDFDFLGVSAERTPNTSLLDAPGVMAAFCEAATDESSWKRREAALYALPALHNSGARGHMALVTQRCLTGLRDPHPLVRNAALAASISFSGPLPQCLSGRFSPRHRLCA